MRHRKRRHRLSRSTSHKKAMLSNMSASLFLHQRIETTLTKAREASRFADRLISLGKGGTLSDRRRAYSILKNRKMVKLLFDEVAPLFSKRNGGYTRTLRTRNRNGDGAQMALLELVDKRAVKEKVKKAPKAGKEKEKTPDAERPVKEEKKPTYQKPLEEKGTPKKGIISKLKGIFKKQPSEEKPSEEKPGEETKGKETDL